MPPSVIAAIVLLKRVRLASATMELALSVNRFSEVYRYSSAVFSSSSVLEACTATVNGPSISPSSHSQVCASSRFVLETELSDVVRRDVTVISSDSSQVIPCA